MVHVGAGGFGRVSSGDTRSVMLSGFTWLLFMVLSVPGAGGSHFCHLGVPKGEHKVEFSPLRGLFGKGVPVMALLLHLGQACGGVRCRGLVPVKPQRSQYSPGEPSPAHGLPPCPFYQPMLKSCRTGTPLESHCSPPTLSLPVICLSAFVLTSWLLRGEV